MESRENPDRLKRSIHVDHIRVQSEFVYIYAALRVLTIWANCLFSFNMFFLLRKVEDVTTISKLQSLTLVKVIDCTLKVQAKLLHYCFMSNNKSNLHPSHIFCPHTKIGHNPAKSQKYQYISILN